ncbi:MAG: hypothetical protein HFJ66_01710 [Eggerthellaceae bacterium]|nr:hypothetical protein [Eggerthellaceae bacterium]
MLTKISEGLSEEIERKTGVKTIDVSELESYVDSLENPSDGFPFAFLNLCLSPTFAESDYQDAAMPTGCRSAFGLDRIPLFVGYTINVFGGSAEEADKAAEAIRRAFPSGTPITLSAGKNGLTVSTFFEITQGRQLPEKKDNFFMVCFTNYSKPATIMPATYSNSALDVSLEDHNRLNELLAIYYYYMTLLDMDAPAIIKYNYPKLFETKRSGLFGKKLGDMATSGLSKGLQGLGKAMSEIAGADVGDALQGIANSLSDDVIKKLAQDYQAGNLRRKDFEDAFRVGVILVPDLYDRTMRREDLSTILAAINSAIAEVEQRANAIADSIGIARNENAEGAIMPRSKQAAQIYLTTLISSADNTMYDALSAYKEQAANNNNSGAGLGSVFSMDGDGFATRAAIIGTVVSSAIASGGRGGATRPEKRDLLGSAGCQRNDPRVKYCLACPIAEGCTRSGM